MEDNNTMSQTQQAAEIIRPPNKIKEAVGNGGLDAQVVRKAQTALEINASAIDFRPQAREMIEHLQHAYNAASSGAATGVDAIEAMIHPAMQLKAQGGMFKYTLLTDVCNILVNFLETAEKIDRNSLAIVHVHLMTIRAIISRSMVGDGGVVGKELRDALMDACNRYYRARLG